MTLPTFLGIGVPRAATTWLHALLAAHPQVYVPRRRKEVSFFNVFYERGIDWYAQFFPPMGEAVRYRQIGEITPHYFFCGEAAKRIASVSSITKLLLILREPVARAYSYYSHIAPLDGYRGTFEEFLQDYPEILQEGFYSKHLKNYLAYFPRDRILVLIYERAMQDAHTACHTIARFLQVTTDGFPRTSAAEVLNRSRVPRFRRAYAAAMSLNRWLRAHDLDVVVNAAIRLGARAAFGRGPSPPPMQQEVREKLRATYAQDVLDLEALLDIDLSCWR